MIKTLEIIFLGALGSLTALLIVKIFRYLKERQSKKNFNRFWDFLNDRIVIVHPLYKDSKGINLDECYCRVEDEYAIQLLIDFFKEIKIKYTIQDHNKEIPNDADLILICSPKGNKQSEICSNNNQEKLPFLFSEDENGKCFFVDQKTSTKYYSPSEFQDKKIDYGMVAKMTDDNPRRRIFLFWGIHGVGTLAALKFSIDGSNLKRIYRTNDCTNFAVLVKAPFRSRREIGEPEQVTVPISIK